MNMSNKLVYREAEPIAVVTPNNSLLNLWQSFRCAHIPDVVLSAPEWNATIEYMRSDFAESLWPVMYRGERYVPIRKTHTIEQRGVYCCPNCNCWVHVRQYQFKGIHPADDFDPDSLFRLSPIKESYVLAFFRTVFEGARWQGEWLKWHDPLRITHIYYKQGVFRRKGVARRHGVLLRAQQFQVEIAVDASRGGLSAG